MDEHKFPRYRVFRGDAFNRRQTKISDSMAWDEIVNGLGGWYVDSRSPKDGAIWINAGNGSGKISAFLLLEPI